MSNKYGFTMRQLLEAGVHFGHKSKLWNPKMKEYIYGVRNGLHIIDLQKTVPLLSEALKALEDVAAQNGKILFVATKEQATSIVSEYAQKCGQYYVNHRWLGGILTNWSTVSASIKTLKEYEAMLANDQIVLTKKERLDLYRKCQKLERALGGIRNMGSTPDILFVIDTNKEELAIKEAQKLHIPVVAIVDTNSSPDEIDHLIPGNDDAIKAITLYCHLASEAVLNGMQRYVESVGVDVGSASEAAPSTPDLATVFVDTSSEEIKMEEEKEEK
ncbi:30S ribosomal protein S2 [Rickettsiales endosymbiont of Peranema trichophorum]|uniref:30S ribosomal protein S2 n=1 Tax=Rickettsiales endosymbiont of Peranema trichophorum TaxID=2486577 RepID=UPI001A92F292|nr:30S ribosomal protein S2 [Rickettsiales endosymbiont of Peranema trichophorum]